MPQPPHRRGTPLQNWRVGGSLGFDGTESKPLNPIASPLCLSYIWPRTPRPILDSEGRVFAVLVGQPDNPSFATSCANVLSLMAQEGKGIQFLKKDKRHRRGHFPAVNVGVMHGKGTQYPINISTFPYSEAVQKLLDDPDVQRLATFSSAAFQQWFPKIFDYYKDRLDQLWGEFTPPEGGSPLKKNFVRSIYTSAAFNFGPQVCTFKHRDYLNCPFGLCAVQALGSFDHTKGGHIVLWEAKIFAEFPANSVILIPSATITHSNLPCQLGETRISFTQYCAGGLFRYVDNGFKTDSQLKEEDPELYERTMKRRESRWKEGLALFSRLEELSSR
ncbi:hypothetical protein BDN72DRAFT_762244 [Pluteus cervinus]|uniref:Uncharacterized protein n=1 Tax=Pluteus cervinus TaxID=181527 RepID=A0ACD3B5B2_9AGAR|nr:hypothetical protein BDN72DRAFT_762244 [Pluteus cervinus]